MGVLNFAHGAFITVGSYGDVVDVGASLRRRALGAAGGCCSARCSGLRVGGVFAALVELVLIRPLYARHIEQVLVTVGLQLAFVALMTGIWGNDPKTFVVPALAAARRPTSAARTSRTTAGSRSRPRPSCSALLQLVPAQDALRADHPRRRREPRDGAPRSASTCARRSRSSSRSAASPPRSPACSAASTSTTSSPDQGHEPADLRVHRRRDRRPRLDRRLGRRCGGRRARRSSTRTTTPRRASAT